MKQLQLSAVPVVILLLQHDRAFSYSSQSAVYYINASCDITEAWPQQKVLIWHANLASFLTRIRIALLL